MKRKILVDTLRLLHSILMELVHSLCLKTPPTVSCQLHNFLFFLQRRKIRFKYVKHLQLYEAKEHGEAKFFGDLQRGFECYSRGFQRRGEFLAHSYCLHEIEFAPDDIVIDCGANYADLFIFLKSHIKEANYVTFEPGPVEYKCISMNVPDARNLNLGLSNELGELDFYLCSKTGDSSLVKPIKYTDVVKVNVTTLDYFMAAEGIGSCKLLKLEAEGWEPEILDGAKNFIRKCEYVAIDGGRERGENCELTFHTLNNYLLKNGFVMQDIYGPSYRAVYKNMCLE